MTAYDDAVIAAMSDPTVIKARDLYAEARTDWEAVDRRYKRSLSGGPEWYAATQRLDEAERLYRLALTQATDARLGEAS